MICSTCIEGNVLGWGIRLFLFPRTVGLLSFARPAQHTVLGLLFLFFLLFYVMLGGREALVGQLSWYLGGVCIFSV